MAVERFSVASLPAGFDPDKHAGKIIAKVCETKGDGWEVESYDPSERRLVLTRQGVVTQTTAATKGHTLTLALAKGTRPTDGDRIASKFEDANPGYTLTEFKPFLGQAVMTKLSTGERQARDATAYALGMKPYDIRVSTRKDRGYTLVLPSYSPSKHDTKLDEVATTVVGKPGWYTQVDPASRTVQMIPADLPTFSASYEYPFDAPAKNVFKVPVGVALGGNGRPNDTAWVDLSDVAGILTTGLAGSGKSVFTTGFLYSLFRRGWQVAVINAPQKKTDFEWAKPFVKDNGWGCETKEDAVAVARLVHEEGMRRGQLLAKHGVSKWQELPEAVRKETPPLILVADEMAAQLMKEAEPKGLPKDHPQRLEVQQENLESDLLAVTLAKIPAEMRAAGIRVLYLTQQAQSNFGIGPKIKVNLPHRLLLGSKPSKQQLGHAFQVPEKLPEIPEHIVADEAQARGVGITEFEGQVPQVFKGYYAPGTQFVAQMRKIGVPTNKTPRPTPSQVARLVPQIADELPDDGPPSSSFDAGGFGQQDGRDIAAGDRLKGAAAASHALAVDAALAAKRKREAATSDDDF